MRAEVAESRRRVDDFARQARQAREAMEAGLAELALRVGVRLEPEDLVRPEVIERLPPQVRRVVKAFMRDLDESAGDEGFRTTRPIGRKLGKMI